MNATFVQRDTALAEANRIRTGMAGIKADVRAGDRSAGCLLVASMLADPSDVMLAMPLGKLLLCIRRLGVRSIGRILFVADVRSFDRRVRDLTPRQRRVLADVLRARATI